MPSGIKVKEKGSVDDTHTFIVVYPSGAKWEYDVNSFHARQVQRQKRAPGRQARYLKKNAEIARRMVEPKTPTDNKTDSTPGEQLRLFVQESNFIKP